MSLERRRSHHLQLPAPLPLTDLAHLTCQVAKLAPHLVGALIWAVVTSSKAVTAYRREVPPAEDVDTLLDLFPEARQIVGASRPGLKLAERRDPKPDLRIPRSPFPAPRDEAGPPTTG